VTPLRFNFYFLATTPFFFIGTPGRLSGVHINKNGIQKPKVEKNKIMVKLVLNKSLL
jgi:hypothetical protein